MSCLQRNNWPSADASNTIISFDFFTVNTELPEMTILAKMDFTASKRVASSGPRPGDHWIKRLFKSVILKQLSSTGIFKLTYHEPLNSIEHDYIRI